MCWLKTGAAALWASHRAMWSSRTIPARTMEVTGPRSEKSEKRNWNPRVTLRSFEVTILDDILPLMAKIAPTPLRMILTDQDTLCSTPRQLEAFAAAGEPKSLMVLPGHHYALYTTWKDAAIAAARAWFVEHLLD